MAKESNVIKNLLSLGFFRSELINIKTKNGMITEASLKSGENIFCCALIITSGTFLNGLIHLGEETFKAGRFGEKPAVGLTESLNNYGFSTGRLKTGTPPRLLSS